MAKAMCFVASLTITKVFDCVDNWLLFYKLFDTYYGWPQKWQLFGTP